MASSNLTRTFVKSLKGRPFASAAAAPQASYKDGPKCSVKKLSNGMVVGVVQSDSPIARLAVVANAGSRFEDGDNLGLSHFLRQSFRLRTQNMSSLGLTRTAQQLGGDITIEGTREHIFFKGSVTRNCSSQMVELLQEMTTKQGYSAWEVSDAQVNKDGLLLDLAILQTNPQIWAVELLHSAAFRNTLGNSLYAPDHMIGKYTPEQLSQYVKTYFSAGRLALIGIGMDQAELEELGSKFEPFVSAAVPVEKAAYCGGEIRDNKGGDLSYVAVGFGGKSLASKDLLATEVLRHIMGTGPHIKYSNGTAASYLAKAAAQATNAPFHVSSLNATYTDNGLFGFTAVAHASHIEKVVQAAASQFKDLASANITDADVARGKNQLKAEICMQFENPDVLLNWLGEQSLGADQIIMPEDIYKMVDAVTITQVKNVAKNISSSKPSMGVTGNVSRVPYLDKLFS